MVKEVADWPWSSYPAMIGVVPAPAWLQMDWLLGQFDPQRKPAQEKYEDFVRAGTGLPSVWSGLCNQIFLGSEAFVARMQAGVSPEQSLNEIPRALRRLPAKSLTSYRAEQGDNWRLGMALAYLSGDYSMKAIADEFDVHYTTVSRASKSITQIGLEKIQTGYQKDLILTNYCYTLFLYFQ